MATPPEGPALDRMKDTTIDAVEPSIAHDQTLTPVPTPSETSLSSYPTTVASPAAMQRELQPGAMVGEYRIEGLLGEGGMGRVYSAVHPVIGKKAAVKVLHPRLSANPEVVERFVQEARAVNQIGHPNIVDIFAFGTLPSGGSYFVMEWLKGESLQERMRRQPLTRDEMCHYVSDVSHALEAAHEQQIVHRDLKPENVFLQTVKGDRFEIKLLDFGIAKLTSNEDTRIERTRTGAMMGTPKYIAPEQARGYAVDHRVDIYSLGVMIFEIVAGRLPFEADNAMDLVAMHLHDTPPILSSVVATPSILSDLVRAMLSKDAGSRPSLARLRQVLDEVRAMPPGEAADLHSSAIDVPRRSRKPIAILGGLAVAGVVGALVVSKVSGTEPSTPPVVTAPVPQQPAGSAIARSQPPVEAKHSVEPPPVAKPSTIAISLARPVAGVLNLDGQNVIGGSPWKLDVAPGSHVVKFTSRGGGITKTVVVEPGKDLTVELTLPTTSKTTPKPPATPKQPPTTPKPPTPPRDDDFIPPAETPPPSKSQ